jgi:predicted amidophosphoribosyltransferase
MIEYAETNACRRRLILDYFGDQGNADAADCCDNHVAAATQPARRAASEDEWIPLVILETVRTVKRQVGRDKIAMIVRGSHAQAIVQWGYQRHKFYGKLEHLTLREIGDVIEQLVERGYLKTIGGEFPVIALAPLGEQTLNARAAISLSAIEAAAQPKRVEKKATSKAGGTIERTLERAQQGLTVAQIAEQRGFAVSTIYGHLEQLVAAGKITADHFIEPNVREQVLAALKHWDGQFLSHLKELLPAEISYDQIRFVLAAQKTKEGSLPSSGTIVTVGTTGALSKDQPNRRDRVHVVWLMGERGSREDVPVLIQSLQDTDGNVRRLAASALGKIKDPRSIQPLMQLLTDSKPQVRQYAIKALGEIASVEAEQALQKIVDDEQENDYNRKSARTALAAIRRVHAPSNGVRVALTNESIGTQHEGATDAITNFLSRAHPKPLYGPWRVGFALDSHRKFVGAQNIRTELGDLVYRFKYGGEESLSETLATRLACFIAAHSDLQADVIVPIPSTKKDRAYDPVPMLAQLISSRLGIAVNDAVLVKARATEPQKEMVNLAQKMDNVTGAFRVAAPNAVRGKRVLLLDDLYDSGTTLAEATRALLTSGAREVCALAITKTIHGE